MTNKQSFSNKLILFGYMCLPVFLISGPFLSDLFVVLICIYFFLFEDFKSIFLNFRKEIYFFLIFLVYLNLNTFFVSDHFFVSLKVTLPYLRFLIFIVFTAYLLSRAEYLKEYILYSCLVCFFCLFLDSLYQFYNGKNILGFVMNDNMRVSSFFGDELVLGSFTSRIIIIILSLFFVLKKFENKKKLLYFLILFIGYCLIILSNERTALLNFITILICFSFIEFRLKNFFLIILTFILINISIFLIYPKKFERIVFSTIDQIKTSSHFLIPSYRHELHYFTALEMFKDNFFFGNGMKSFRYKCDDPKYRVKNKIEVDKKIYAPVNGYIHINKKKGSVHLITTSTSSHMIFVGFAQHIVMNSFKFEENDYVVKGQYLGSFYAYKNGCNTHPHNVHLQFLAELGLFGYVFLISFLIFIIREITILIKDKFRSNIHLDPKKKSYFICLIGIFMQINPLLPSGNFFNNYNSILFFLNLAFLLYFRRANKLK